MSPAGKPLIVISTYVASAHEKFSFIFADERVCGSLRLSVCPTRQLENKQFQRLGIGVLTRLSCSKSASYSSVEPTSRYASVYNRLIYAQSSCGLRSTGLPRICISRKLALLP